MGKRIWDNDISHLLYRGLVTQFGPHMAWETQAHPGKEHKERFDAFCNSFAVIIGATSGEAVKNQIAWAYTKQEDVRNEYVDTWFRNRVAAYLEGFIDHTYLPNRIICEYR